MVTVWASVVESVLLVSAATSVLSTVVPVRVVARVEADVWLGTALPPVFRLSLQAVSHSRSTAKANVRPILFNSTTSVYWT